MTTRTTDGYGQGARVRVQGRPVASHPYPTPEAARGTVLRVTEVGEEVLSRPCRAVTGFGSGRLAELVADMFATLYAAEGAGLAANQVGVDAQLFVFDCTDDDGIRHVGHIANPVLAEVPAAGRRLVEADEGCLSVPGASAVLARLDHALVRGRDLDGAPVDIEGGGYFARCLQHEMDHLAGRLYLDRLPARARRRALAQMAERRDEVLARRAERAHHRPDA